MGLWLSVAGCRGAASQDAAAALAVVHAHARDITGLVRWARGLSVGETRFGSQAARQEAAFAPVRETPGLTGAWIERQGPDPALLSHPAGQALPGELEWQRARDPEIGVLEFAVVDAHIYVRIREDASDGATQLVTLAFSR